MLTPLGMYNLEGPCVSLDFGFCYLLEPMTGAPGRNAKEKGAGDGRSEDIY